MDSTGWEQLVCNGCGRAGAPRPAATRGVLPCGCGSRDYGRRPLVALEQDELDYVIEVVEFYGAVTPIAVSALEQLYAEQRWDVAFELDECAA